MIYQLIFAGMSLAVLASMVGFQFLGRSFAVRHPQRREGTTGTGLTTIETTVFALLGLLVAFSFSGAESRLQMRRDLIVQEVNAIGTAYLRLDLLPESDRPHLKEQFRRYVDARVAYYAQLKSRHGAAPERARAEQLQREIWQEAVRSGWRAADLRASTLTLPALNEMFDITTSREAALWMHIPIAVFLFLALLSCACAFLVGIEMAPPEPRSLLHVFAFAAAMALTTYVILNLEFPRAGFVRLGYLDALLEQLRAQMT